MLRIARAALAAVALTLTFAAPPVFAQASSAVASVVSVAPGVIVVPTGNWIIDALPLIAAVVLMLAGVLIAMGIRLLPPSLQALAGPAVQAQLMALTAYVINWGVEAVSGAVKGKELDINVGNAVVAKAAQEALDTWPADVIAKLGGADGVKKWIIAQLNAHGVVLPPESTAGAVLASAPVAAVKPGP